MKRLLYIKDKYSSALLIMILLSLLLGKFSSSRTVISIPFLILIFYAFIQKDFIVKYTTHIIVLLFLCAFSYIFNGVVIAKSMFLTLFGLLTTKFYIQKYNFNPRIIIILYLCFFIPQFIFEFFTFGGVSYLPPINILTHLDTKHGSSALGLLLLLSSILYFFNVRFISKKAAIILLILGSYLMLFSSRTGLVSFFYILGFILINHRQVNTKLSFVYFFLALFALFSLESLMPKLLLGLNNETILQYLKVDNQSGITAGRSWLWDYHLTKFYNSDYFMGAGLDPNLSFSVGDYIPELGVNAEAAGESSLTYNLASNGLLGLFQNFVYLYFVYFSFTRKKLFSMIISSLAFVLMISGFDVYNFNSYFSVLFVNLLFMESRYRLIRTYW